MSGKRTVKISVFIVLQSTSNPHENTSTALLKCFAKFLALYTCCTFARS